ncbi:hypothetical protein JLK41_11785 [Ectopseudomonas khazarica]|uniref:hypothetical protein n=1 Tax=Ectopseudomonas khazarica TaxID=2502979 RepID=UPI001AEF6C87|nr:hypothetical protein [Pseudomonas khazarica]QTS88791.1 hypothetical protein JLK41_11785 [Pseudomonas khazarica]
MSFFDRAQLAEASYTLFEYLGGDFSDEDVADILQEPERGGSFSQTQAEEFINTWRVISHTKNTSNGFSATLFQSKETGKYIYATRGTEPGNAWSDIVETDIADIVLDGLAINQIVDMYNDWQYLNAEAAASYQVAQLSLLLGETAALAAARLTTPIGTSDYELALRARSDIIIDMPTGMVYTIEFVESQEYYDDHRALGSGVLHGQQVELDVTGHSLGGHLAAAFTRLFPETGAEATTINGAGFATELIEGLDQYRQRVWHARWCG